MQNKKDAQKLHDLRHSAAHLLAQALCELYPGTLLTLGPVTDDGFFYDFLPPQGTISEADLPAIEEKMKEISARNLPIVQKEISKEEARELYKDNPFKLELIDGIEEDTIGLSCQGDFCDLCRGGHTTSTGDIKNFKLLYVAGSYWRADKDKQALQRVYGTAFETKKELDTYLQRREDALKYDHRRIGKELDLFSFQPEGVGFPFFHPKGKQIFNLLVEYVRRILTQNGWQEIATPIMLSEKLWHQSGHYEHYRDNMYFSDVDDKRYAIKPMNCPGGCLIYKNRPRSYRELPLRMSEIGLVHRHELSGVLHGLLRVRAFTQDDGHIYCTPEQIESEVLREIQTITKAMRDLGFENVSIALSTKPDNAMGDNALWQQATDALASSLKKAGLEYTVQEGEGAFYGPKIEFMIEDSMGRVWQCGTIQVDFFMPENFDLEYVTNEGTTARPVMIHRAMFGSFERFLGILLEHYKGRLPFWLAPVQARVLTITDEQRPYAQKLFDTLKQHNIRIELDESSDQISTQIKAAQLQQIPWMLVVGKKEVANNTITLRHRDGKQEFGLTVDQLLERAQELTPTEMLPIR